MKNVDYWSGAKQHFCNLEKFGKGENGNISFTATRKDVLLRQALLLLVKVTME